jgi:hypothetical protein
MAAPKLVRNPPDGSGLVPSIVDRHYADLTRGKPGELIAARVLLQPVGTKLTKTKAGTKTEVVYEMVRCEPVRDSHEADKVAWEIGRDYELRTSTGAQEQLPMSSPGEQREQLLDSIRDWASENDTSWADLDARWTDYYGGRQHAASETVQAGSLLQLMEFARVIGAVQDPKPGEDDDDLDAAADEDDSDDPDGDLPAHLQPGFTDGSEQ